MEASGTLHPAVDAATGERSFDLGEVERVAAERAGKDAPQMPAPTTSPRSDGEVAADVFRLLDHGKSLTSIVIELGLPPEVVERSAQAWMRLKQQDLSAPSVPATVARLVQAVNWLLPMVKQLREKCLEACPLVGVHEEECEQCGAVGYVAVETKCTGCGRRVWFGHWPDEDDNTEE
jgi:hypothetical protein